MLMSLGKDDNGPDGSEAHLGPAATNLSFNAISHVYDGVEALADVSFAVETGEIVALLGQSGCGKTTLLRIAAGIERPSEGRILIDGETVVGPDVFVPAEHRAVGLMFQDFALFPHLSILDNVMFGLKKLPKDEARKQALQALTRVGLEHRAGDYPHTLSGGMQQRVALARATVPRPRVLLMDEPFSGLDRRTRDKVRDETLSVIRQMGATSIVVTHDPEEALHIADRIILMRGGRIVQDGSPRDFFYQPKDLFAARFFAELNEFSGTVEGGAVRTPLGRFDTSWFADGTPVDIGVRHASIRVSRQGEGTLATIRKVRFFGDANLLEVVAEGVEQVIYVRDASPEDYRAGDDVTLYVPPDEVLAFESTGSGPT